MGREQEVPGGAYDNAACFSRKLNRDSTPAAPVCPGLSICCHASIAAVNSPSYSVVATKPAAVLLEPQLAARLLPPLLLPLLLRSCSFYFLDRSVWLSLLGLC
jgi:hypothetical protein